MKGSRGVLDRRNAPSVHAGGQCGDLAAGGAIGNKNPVGQGGDQVVAAVGGIGGDAARGFLERGQQEQAAGVQGGLPGAGEAHSIQGAGQAEDERLPAAQEDVQAVPFDRGMEAADDGFALVAEPGGSIVGAKDGVTGAASRAEQNRAVLWVASRAGSPMSQSCWGASAPSR